MIRVLVVDDSAFARQALLRMLKTDPEIEVVGMAGDGKEALERIRELRPDVVTLDVQMPRMGGLEALERIMAEQPVAVLLLSSLTQEGGEITLRGLELGAMDFVDKSSAQGSMNLLSLAEELKAKVHAPRRRASRARPGAASSQAAPEGGCHRPQAGRPGGDRGVDRWSHGPAGRDPEAPRRARVRGARSAAHARGLHPLAGRAARFAKRPAGTRGRRRRARDPGHGAAGPPAAVT